MTSIFEIPRPLRTFFAYFPLRTYPSIPPPSKNAVSSPTLWIQPPRGSQEGNLSADVECLKWQAYLALRGLTNVAVRWDISTDGGIDGRLPNLHVPGKDDGQLLAAHNIPSWVDSVQGPDDALEGFKDKFAKDESHSWIALLEGNVHAALVGSSRTH